MLTIPPIGLTASKTLGSIGAAFFDDDTSNPPSRAEIDPDNLVENMAINLATGGAITIEIWAYSLSEPGASNAYYLVERRGTVASSINWGLGFANSGQSVAFKHNGGSTQTATRSTGLGDPTGQWVHLAVTRLASTGVIKLYVNGAQVGTDEVDAIGDFEDASGTPYVLLGHGSESNSAFDFHGYLAEFRLWDYVRSPAELLNNYNIALAGNEAGLVAYYPMQSDFSDATGDNQDFSLVAGGSVPAPSIAAFSRPF